MTIKQPDLYCNIHVNCVFMCACVGGWVLGCVRALCVRARCAHTGAQVGVLLGQVLALMDPFPVALEEDLQRGLGPAAEVTVPLPEHYSCVSRVCVILSLFDFPGSLFTFKLKKYKYIM